MNKKILCVTTLALGLTFAGCGKAADKSAVDEDNSLSTETVTFEDTELEESLVSEIMELPTEVVDFEESDEPIIADIGYLGSSMNPDEDYKLFVFEATEGFAPDLENAYIKTESTSVNDAKFEAVQLDNEEWGDIWLSRYLIKITFDGDYADDAVIINAINESNDEYASDSSKTADAIYVDDMLFSTAGEADYSIWKLDGAYYLVDNVTPCESPEPGVSVVSSSKIIWYSQSGSIPVFFDTLAAECGFATESGAFYPTLPTFALSVGEDDLGPTLVYEYDTEDEIDEGSEDMYPYICYYKDAENPDIPMMSYNYNLRAF